MAIAETGAQEMSHNLTRLERNSIIQPLLTDLYQITMAYAYWKSGKTKDTAAFDLFFRKNPFQGEFTIFAGLEECLKFLENFHYSDSDIEYLRETLPPTIENEFFEYLRKLTVKDITVYAVDEGSVAFPRVPLIRIEGPLIVTQILETTLLTLVNYASLMATNAARYRMAAGSNLRLLEFGLRRAQGPDGGLSASKYSYIGGFDGTSNVLAGKLFNIPVGGTHAHAYITSFSSMIELQTKTLVHRKNGTVHDLSVLAAEWRTKLAPLFQVLGTEASDGELAALISFAIAFPDGFVALVDTYDVKRYSCRMPHTNVTLTPITMTTCNDFKRRHMFVPILARAQSNMHSHTPESLEQSLRSGLLNFCAVAMALNDLGYKAIGIRIDSGDLAYLSNVSRHYFKEIARVYDIPWFADLMIMASNDINEDTILSLNEQGHQINCFGIGTHLVTCQRQPALGCVYKLVEINGQPRIKLSQDVGKVTMPGRKVAYRLYGSSDHALIDLLQRATEPPPEVGEKVLCRHPFEESKRAYVIPTKVEKLHHLYYQNGKIVQTLPTLDQIRERVRSSLKTLRTDIKRNLNPTPFKVAVSDQLYNFIHDLWLENAPIGELS